MEVDGDAARHLEGAPRRPDPVDALAVLQVRRAERGRQVFLLGRDGQRAVGRAQHRHRDRGQRALEKAGARDEQQDRAEVERMPAERVRAVGDDGFALAPADEERCPDAQPGAAHERDPPQPVEAEVERRARPDDRHRQDGRGHGWREETGADGATPPDRGFGHDDGLGHAAEYTAAGAAAARIVVSSPLPPACSSDMESILSTNDRARDRVAARRLVDALLTSV